MTKVKGYQPCTAPGCTGQIKNRKTSCLRCGAPSSRVPTPKFNDRSQVKLCRGYR